MRHLRLFASLLGVGAIGGCAMVPAVNMQYVMPKARVVVAVTQTIGCSAADFILSVATGTVTTSYVPDYDGPRGAIDFSAADSRLVDSDVAVSLTDDGRLSSFNANYTGEAASVVKSLVALAGTFSGARPQAAVTAPSPDHAFCIKLALYAAPKPPGAAAAVGAGGAPAAAGVATPIVTLTYTGQFDFEQTNTTINVVNQLGEVIATLDGSGSNAASLDLLADANSSPIVDSLASALGRGTLAFKVMVQARNPPPTQPAANPSVSGKGAIQVPGLNVLNLILMGPVGDLSKQVISTTAQAIIPTRNLVSVPIGESQPFGKINTSLTVAASGLVNKLEYSKTSGLADLFTSANQIAAQVHPAAQTTAQKAAETQGQADLIYQQQRLIACQAAPIQCSGK